MAKNPLMTMIIQNLNLCLFVKELVLFLEFGYAWDPEKMMDLNIFGQIGLKAPNVLWVELKISSPLNKPFVTVFVDNCHSLTCLNLAGSSLPMGVLRHLLRLKSLKELDVSDIGIGVMDFVPTEKAPVSFTLKRLNIIGRVDI